jgi:L-amino acid N-acyltransferase YncA
MMGKERFSESAGGRVLSLGSLRYRIRPLRADDLPLLGECFSRLSTTSRRHRFLGTKRALSDMELEYFSNADQRDHIALTALELDEGGAEHALLGAARCFRLAPGGTDAELSIAVADTAQGIGLGGQLLARLIGTARVQGIHRFVFEVMESNTAMRALAARFGSKTRSLFAGVVSYELLLSEVAPTDAEPQSPVTEGPRFAELERAWLTASEQQVRFGSLVAEIAVDWMRFLDPASRFPSALRQSGRESTPTMD